MYINNHETYFLIFFIFLTGAHIQETALSLTEPVDSGLFINNARTVRTLETTRDGLNHYERSRKH